MGSINTTSQGLLLSEEALPGWPGGQAHTVGLGMQAVSPARHPGEVWKDQHKVVTPLAGYSLGCADGKPETAGSAARQWEHRTGGPQHQSQCRYLLLTCLEEFV